MKTQAHRRQGGTAGFQNAWTRTFGSGPVVPRARRWLPIPLAVLALLGAGAAWADWQVDDDKTQREIKRVQDRIGSDGTVTGQLKDINRKLQVSPQSGSTPEMIKEPTGDEALDKTNPTAQMVAMDQLCTIGTSSTLGTQQQQLCQEMAKTELAQYRFSMRMFERSKENYDRLKKLEDRRRGLKAEDYANVQYNTNEILALTALMDNDRDRYRTYMAAYDARMAHIQNSRAALTRNALKGSGSIGIPGL